MKSLILAAMLALAACDGQSGALPNDCAIVATEAFARLREPAAWTKVLLIDFYYVATCEIGGHVLVVWQVTDDGEVQSYDGSGALALETHSREVKDIQDALNKANPACHIFAARFLE